MRQDVQGHTAVHLIISEDKTEKTDCDHDHDDDDMYPDIL